MIYRWLCRRFAGGRVIADLAFADPSATPVGASKNTFPAISKTSLTWRYAWTAVGISIDFLSSETWRRTAYTHRSHRDFRWRQCRQALETRCPGPSFRWGLTAGLGVVGFISDTNRNTRWWYRCSYTVLLVGMRHFAGGNGAPRC
jgi:hypothetical protein